MLLNFENMFLFFFLIAEILHQTVSINIWKYKFRGGNIYQQQKQVFKLMLRGENNILSTTDTIL